MDTLKICYERSFTRWKLSFCIVKFRVFFFAKLVAKDVPFDKCTYRVLLVRIWRDMLWEDVLGRRLYATTAAGKRRWEIRRLELHSRHLKGKVWLFFTYFFQLQASSYFNPIYDQSTGLQGELHYPTTRREQIMASRFLNCKKLLDVSRFRHFDFNAAL